MDLEKALTELAEKAKDLKGQLTNEAVTISALVLPFINALGYNDSNPLEVFPQYSADFGDKKGAKVDIAIMHDGEPSILFECKQATAELEAAHLAQLMKYFAAAIRPKGILIGILTNGIVYKFYSDLDDKHKMDQQPFLVIDLMNLSESSIKELSGFTKQGFDVKGTIEAASELKYTRGMKQVLANQLAEPEDGFIQWLVKQVYNGSLTKKKKITFTPLVKRAFREFIDERINQTLTKALDRSADEETTLEENGEKDMMVGQDAKGIVTTVEEIKGHAMVQGILSGLVDTSRVTMKDWINFCGIYLDKPSGKPICRLYFNDEESLELGVFNEEKLIERHGIESPEDIISRHADAIIATARRYLEESPTPQQ